MPLKESTRVFFLTMIRTFQVAAPATIVAKTEPPDFSTRCFLCRRRPPAFSVPFLSPLTLLLLASLLLLVGMGRFQSPGALTADARNRAGGGDGKE